MEKNNSLFEHYSFSVDHGQSPLRIDKYLMNFIENATRSKIQEAAKNESIYVPIESKHRLSNPSEIPLVLIDRTAFGVRFGNFDFNSGRM